jgi:hypothetical protein
MPILLTYKLLEAKAFHNTQVDLNLQRGVSMIFTKLTYGHPNIEQLVRLFCEWLV